MWKGCLRKAKTSHNDSLRSCRTTALITETSLSGLHWGRVCSVKALSGTSTAFTQRWGGTTTRCSTARWVSSQTNIKAKEGEACASEVWCICTNGWKHWKTDVWEIGEKNKSCGVYKKIFQPQNKKTARKHSESISLHTVWAVLLK